MRDRFTDSQKEKVYRAEDRWRSFYFDKSHTLTSLEETQVYADKVAAALLKRGWALKAPHVRYKKGGQRFGAWSQIRTGELVFGKMATTFEIIMHEVCHLAGVKKFAGHGIPFCMALLDAVEELYGSEQREALAFCFRERKVKYSWVDEAPRNRLHFRHWLKYKTENVRVQLQTGEMISAVRVISFDNDEVILAVRPIAATNAASFGVVASGSRVVIPMADIAFTKFSHGYCTDECGAKARWKESW